MDFPLKVAERASELAGYATIFLTLLSALLTVIVLVSGNIKEANFKLQIAEANSVAQIAKQKAESERLARLKLEAKIAPRRLSKGQKATLVAGLNSFKGEKIRIESYALDLEGQVFAEQVREIYKPEFRIEDWIGSEPARNGFAKGVNITGVNKKFVKSLVNNFKSAGISNVSSNILPPPEINAMLAESSREKDKSVSAVILIGVKPLS